MKVTMLHIVYVYLTHLKVCVSGEAGDVAASIRVILPVNSGAVLGGDGVVARDVIVVILVREVEQKVTGARRDDWSK